MEGLLCLSMSAEFEILGRFSIQRDLAFDAPPAKTRSTASSLRLK